MSLRKLLDTYIPQYTKLSKTEATLLETMITVNSGNAYGLWKASGLKHYPTALRTIKKLEKKRLAQVLSVHGTHGERIYIPTLFGTLLHYALKDGTAQLMKLISQNSDMFDEMVNSEEYKDEASDWIPVILQRVARDVAEGKSPNIDRSVKEALSGYIVDCLINIAEDYVKKKYENDIIKLSKVESIEKLILEQAEKEIERCKKTVYELRRLKETLVRKPGQKIP